MKNPTPEELKAEVIKKAWIAEIGEKAYNTLKPHIDGNGCMCWDNHNGAFELRTEVFEKVAYDESGYHDIRPKSLSGIENNNGWIRIEPDGSNLPEIAGDYLFCNNRNERFYLKDFDPKIHGVKTYTHYKLLDFKSPIY